MTTLRNVALILCGPLLILTYFLVQGSMPEPARHEQTLTAVRTLVLSNAALQRDVLRARAGLIRSYDALVQSIEGLRRSAAALAPASEIAAGAERAELHRLTAAIDAAIAEQEQLLEQFKSQNAQLSNSVSYFNHLVSEQSQRDGSPSELATLGAAMLRFMGEPGSESIAAAIAAIDGLEAGVARAPPDSPLRQLAPLVAHGRLIVATLPAVNQMVARMQADPIGRQARALQDGYLAAYGDAAARARLFRNLIYAAAVLLAGYAAYLVLRLRRNARSLRQRLDFEKLIAAVSTEFINLPRDRIDDGLTEGLARLAAHADVDCAWLLVAAREGGDARALPWCRDGMALPEVEDEELVRVAASGAGVLYMHKPQFPRRRNNRRGPAITLPAIRSWLSIPMGDPAEPVGFLVLVTLTDERRWASEDIALLRTASEIFASAILRERGESERERLGARLREAERLEAIGTLAGGIAHEFNNVLGIILGYGEMTLARLRHGSRAHRHLGQIMIAGTRGRSIVDQVLAFSRRRAHRYRPTVIQGVIVEAVELLRATLPATLAVDEKLDAEGANVMSEPGEIQQVVINLCRNAAQAMEGRGKLRIEAGVMDLANPTSLSHGKLPAGRHLRLAVCDNGPGIPTGTMERIFEPFFTTKPAGKGTGLGLATVHGIVAEHGGALNVESQPGAGTTFEAFFPLTDAPTIPTEPLDAPAVQHGAGETILLVDDEQPLVQLGEEMLASIGYEPVGFEASAAALAAVRADPERFDLVLTDEVMPEMTGTELAAAVHRIRPDLPVVLMTGYAGGTAPERLHAAGIAEVIRKPLLSGPVAACLARHLPHR